MSKNANPYQLKNIIGVALVTIGISVIAYVWYANSSVSTINRTFSNYTILTGSWEDYKKRFINEDGRVIDHTNEVTTSEGQSYAMLRSVWIDDKEIFDSVWQFTKDNLQRENDNLFGWQWGQIDNDTYGFLQPGGENTASDADSDIALALIFASRRWGDNSYLSEALQILDDFWNINTVEVDGKRYVIAGNWANGEQEVVFNPSYLAPYAYKIFSEVDPDKDWLSLVTTSYEILNRSSNEQIGDVPPSGLPPDWVSLNKETNKLIPPTQGNLGIDYSYDAIRVPFRIALDYQWNNELLAKEYFENSLERLYENYTNTGKLAAIYSHSGEILADYENPSMYATSLGYFMIQHPELAEEIYQNKVIGLYSNGVNAFNEDLPYYEQNLLWFGTALYNDRLIKL